jgi:hypothetical protein
LPSDTRRIGRLDNLTEREEEVICKLRLGWYNAWGLVKISRREEGGK